MQSIGAKFNSLFAVVLFFAAIFLRLSMLLFNLSTAANYIFYILVALVFVFTVLDLKSQKLSEPFIFENQYHLNIFAYAVAAGFFIDFVSHCVSVYLSVENNMQKIPIHFIPICIACAFSLISSFYFMIVGLSFGGRRYDFREFKFIHIAPVGWAIARILMVLRQAVSFSNDVDDIVKYGLLILLLCFFYCFASEIDHDGGTSVKTVCFAKMLSFMSALYFLDRLFLLLRKSAMPSDIDGLFAVSALLISSFVFFFWKNIIHNSSPY